MGSAAARIKHMTIGNHGSLLWPCLAFLALQWGVAGRLAVAEPGQRPARSGPGPGGTSLRNEPSDPRCSSGHPFKSRAIATAQRPVRVGLSIGISGSTSSSPSSLSRFSGGGRRGAHRQAHAGGRGDGQRASSVRTTQTIRGEWQRIGRARCARRWPVCPAATGAQAERTSRSS